MHLEDVFEDYKKYTGSTEEYSSSEFSRKLKNTLNNYNMLDYLKPITPTDKKPYSKDGKYTFTQMEKQLFALLLGCNSPRLCKNPDKFPDKSILNPFLHKNHRKSMGLSDMKSYTDHFISCEKKMELTYPAKPGLTKITTFIDFAIKLKECLKKLIIAIFYMNNFNTMTFDRILIRLNGFIDELYLLNSIDEVPAVDLHHTYNKNEFYHSVDILTAADVGDYIYISQMHDKARRMNFPSDANYINKFSEYKKKKPKYTNLLNINPIHEYECHINKDYKKYLRYTIFEMYRVYIKMLKKNYSEDKILKTLYKKFDYNINIRSVETLIFNKYIKPQSKYILNGSKTLEETAESTYAEIEDLLLQSDKQAISYDKENNEIDEQLDKLLFKPFIRFHDIDLEKLRKKAAKNSECLSYISRKDI
ncbi:MAG: hypothetical protein MRZ29_06255 [Oscillospiraceae bacterium]|nr:hypothetical protein [Oscillospiraceae bacterium]